MDFKGLENIKFVIFHVTEPFVWLVRDTKVNTRKKYIFCFRDKCIFTDISFCFDFHSESINMGLFKAKDVSVLIPFVEPESFL